MNADSARRLPSAQRVRLYVPLAAFGALVVVLYLGFTLRDPHELPSALIDQAFPPFELPSLRRPEQRLTEALLEGETRLVNVWATWCPTCLAEHAELLRIKRETGLSIIGVNYKDDPDKAVRWLEQYGDPYDVNIVDRNGDLGVDLGVYGAPESFLVDRDGVIRYKRVSDINPRVWEQELAPLVARLAGDDD